MILDGRFVPPRDEKNLVDLVSKQLFRHILNDGLARHRQHFLGLRLCRRKQPGTNPGHWNDCASNHLLNITGYVLMIHLETSADDFDQRLDLYLHRRLPEYSRARLQEWIKAGRVRVNNSPQKPSYVLRGSESIEIDPAAPPPLHAQPEEMPLEILYEDADVIAVNKPAGMAVHSGAGRHSGTLVNALLHRFQKLSTVGGALRPGIVHRLDRLTSGVILVARTDKSHRHLAEQFSSRQVEKVYLALVHGRVKADRGKVTTPITRDPV